MKQTTSYSLRRPLCLWQADRELSEIGDYCKKNRIDDVMWFVSAGITHKGLQSTAETEAYVPVLKKAKQVLERVGVTCSINVFTTYGGHSPRSREPQAVLRTFEPRVDWRGMVSKKWPCPLSPVFQEWMADQYSTFAAAAPHSIWVDDDFRHLAGGDTTYICYCPIHLKRFSEVVGEPNVSRERLIECILATGIPHPWRAKWLETLNQGMVETAHVIEHAVHAVSPDTRVAQMTSAYFLHEMEGRDYSQVVKTLGGSHTPTVRISASGYWEGDLRTFYAQDENYRHSVMHVPGDAERCSEIDNCPNSLYRKSATWMRAQMLHSCLLNIPHQTLAVHDHTGTAVDCEPEVGAMLRQAKPQLETIARMFCGNGQFHGVKMLSHPKIAQLIPLESPTPDGFASMGTGWADALRGFGFPIVFNGNDPVIAITGRVLWAYRDQLDEIFSRGVLLDYSALETLKELGREDLAGVSPVRRYQQNEGELPVSAEQLTDPQFGGGEQCYNWLPGPVAVMQPHPGTRVISEFINCDVQAVFPGVTVYQNKLGGRCCVYGYDFSGKNPPDMFSKGTGPDFFNQGRHKQLSRVISWLGKEMVPLQVTATGWVLPHRVDFQDRIMLAAMNLNLDAWEKVEFNAATSQPIRRVLLLTAEDTFVPVEAQSWKHHSGIFQMTVTSPISMLEVVAVALELQVE